ncbi:flagellar brake protein [Leadbettera azotonutricia]|uniref:Type IV pilus assembly protein PilZ n=1 Tax=Leadbettera azotonutricia (strain ATCC BAA-888 / DSM 13862 / ZAS-9) TaxID=545695 RepID=F5YAB9_LEAAZ|nr:PilZ domain-containing protein [Leadbettera azotonutricia]AEF80420.1 type IV pilus assembly protein PilZ [Leadbettera azotonutricia ZAS-9]
MLPVLIIIIVVGGVVALVLARSKKGKSASWIQFYAKGKDSGFSFKEIELLRRLAVKANLEDPASLYWSQNQLDVCIRSLVRNMHLTGEDSDTGSHDFLSKLYDYRKKIEMDKPSIKNGISNSRQISDGQNLRVLVAGSGVFKSQIVKNTNQYITISRPTSTKLPGSFSWQNMKISAYFWREDDAGYVFDSEVLDEVFSKGIASLKISHSDSLFRTQKRKSIRVKLHKSAFLYLLANEEDANKIEVNPGLKCFLEDLSDTGCAVTIGGKAVTGLRVKVQFALNNIPIIMVGTVRSVEYKEDLNRSLLHIESDPLPIEIRNQILGEVFGMLPEEEEDLPFRLLNEEAEGGVASEAPGNGASASEKPPVSPIQEQSAENVENVI